MRTFAKKEKNIFWIIIFISSVLRFYNYYSWSFTHDELGAFVRLNYTSFSEFIREGVQDNDTHPALVQLFLFGWTKIFGLSEVAIRLPFVIAGIGSVALVYLIAKKWFGFATACFSSLTIGILDFPVLYSQLARPYSFGLFFSLLAVWCWTNLLFPKETRQVGDEKKIYRKAIYYGIATALCMLTHYFAFFFAAIVALTGFLFLKKETWKSYLLSGIIALLIFLPHISVSLSQFSKGGVGEWLGKPESDYLWQFILYAFNESPFVIISMAVLFLLSLLIYHLDLSLSKFHFICLAWFLLPFAAGYYYSIKVNPVLQYSTLLFSFPFFPILLFSFFKEGKTKINNILLTSMGVVLLYSTIIEQNFYKREYFGVFKEINQAVASLQKKYGEKNVTTILNTSSKEIFNFYFKQIHTNPTYDFYIGDDKNFESRLRDKIDSCNTPYFLYGWSNFRSPYEIPEMIKEKFSFIVYDEIHFNSHLTLFGKSDTCTREIVFNSGTSFEKPSPSFSFALENTDSTQAHSGKHSLNIQSGNEFCITLKNTVKNIFKENNCVSISGWVFATDTFNAQMVMDIGNPKESHEWQARLLNQFVSGKNKWQKVFATFELPSLSYPEDEVSIYLWNPGKNTFYLDEFTVSSFADSKYHYYKTSYRK